jgi:hypothetical protein
MTTITAKQLNRNRLSGVTYDEKGLPVGYTTEEVFDSLDKRLIDHFGEEYRKLANERRSQWNEKSSWNFKPL